MEMALKPVRSKVCTGRFVTSRPQVLQTTDLREGLPRMLRPAKTCPRVKRLLLIEPVSLKATSPSFPVDCTHRMFTVSCTMLETTSMAEMT